MLFPGLREHGAGPLIVVGMHDEAARNGTDAAFDDAGVAVEDHGLDAGAGEQRLQPRKAHRIIGAQQLFHSACSAVLCWSNGSPGLDPVCNHSMLAFGPGLVKLTRRMARRHVRGGRSSEWPWWQARGTRRRSVR